MGRFLKKQNRLSAALGKCRALAPPSAPLLHHGKTHRLPAAYPLNS